MAFWGSLFLHLYCEDGRNEKLFVVRRLLGTLIAFSFRRWALFGRLRPASIRRPFRSASRYVCRSLGAYPVEAPTVFKARLAFDQDL